MKLSDTFRHRIIIDGNDKPVDSVKSCMVFLDSLTIDPETERKLSIIKKKIQRLKSDNSVSRRHRKKKLFFYSVIVPFMRDIAPENCYFGVHPEDENLFGFWEKSLLL